MLYGAPAAISIVIRRLTEPSAGRSRSATGTVETSRVPNALNAPPPASVSNVGPKITLPVLVFVIVRFPKLPATAGETPLGLGKTPSLRSVSRESPVSWVFEILSVAVHCPPGAAPVSLAKKAPEGLTVTCAVAAEARVKPAANVIAQRRKALLAFLSSFGFDTMMRGII
jgi:hypothetical protein